jgi:hypothetical protein
MGGRLTTPPSSASSSSTTAHRTLPSNPSANIGHTRTHTNSSNHSYQQQPSAHHRHRSNSSHQNSHGLFGNNPATNSRHRTGSNNIDPLSTTAFNLNLLRYVGLDHESDDQSSDDDSPQAHRRLQHFIIALRDVHCPVCNKIIPHDTFDKHIVQCLSKPRIDYNGLLRFQSMIVFFIFIFF